jgi:uncharacterized protein YsxB (DUF464 family)
MSIEVKNLTKSFDNRKILDNISFKVDDGYVNLDVLDITNDNIQLIIDVIVVQLKTIEESYTKYIKIYEE